MSVKHRVVDLRSGIIDPHEIIVEGARSPEDAVRQALGCDLVRSGQKRHLAARVYFQLPDQPVSMVRLYNKAEGQ
ncbi:hypothetical protein [Devosia sp. 2618]|uniref:hypothetical protein n=1 Tax=Devosia sp. 2618 TaxID=3156454 RepID=UPI003396C757